MRIECHSSAYGSSHRGRRGYQLAEFAQIDVAAGDHGHDGTPPGFSAECGGQPQPHGKAVEGADLPINPTRYCYRAPGQRQRTKSQPFADQMIKGELPGTLRHVPAEQGSPE